MSFPQVTFRLALRQHQARWLRDRRANTYISNCPPRRTRQRRGVSAAPPVQPDRSAPARVVCRTARCGKIVVADPCFGIT